jgi:hypothetical protein
MLYLRPTTAWPCAGRWLTAALGALLAISMLATTARAQTDYYNTDGGRPITIEDAYPTERYAFELQLAPLRLERSRGGVYAWGVEPQLAYGIFPRTQLELGALLGYVDAGAGQRVAGLAGLDIAVLHNLNVETSIPALAVAGSVILPVGGLGPEEVYPSLKAILTRTYSCARFHVNAEVTFGSRLNALSDAHDLGRPEGAGVVELSRWLAGLAVDRTLPIQSTLLTAEVFAREPLRREEDVEWTAGAGLRYQLSPRFALDGGVGRSLTGDDQAWFATFGLAYAFGVLALIP